MVAWVYPRITIPLNNDSSFKDFLNSLSYYHKDCESHLEAILYDQCRNLGLEPEVQKVFGKYRVDQAYALSDGTYLIVEADGSQHYKPKQLKNDAIRDQELMDQGHKVIRFETDYLLNLGDAWNCAIVINRAFMFLEEEMELNNWRSQVIDGVLKLKEKHTDQESIEDLDKTRKSLEDYFENIFGEFYQPTNSFERMITQVHIERRNAVWRLKNEDRLTDVNFRLYKPDEDVI